MYKKCLLIFSILLPTMLAGCDNSSTDKQPVEDQANAAMSVPDQVPDSSTLDTPSNTQPFVSPQATEPTQTAPSSPPVTGDMTQPVPGITDSTTQPTPNKNGAMTPPVSNNGTNSTMGSGSSSNATQ